MTPKLVGIAATAAVCSLMGWAALSVDVRCVPTFPQLVRAGRIRWSSSSPEARLISSGICINRCDHRFGVTITDRPATAACAATQIALVSEGYPESYRLVAIDAAGRILWSHAQVLAGEMVSLEATAPDRIAAQFYVRGGDPTLHLHEWIVGAAGAMSYRVERRDAVAYLFGSQP